MMSSVDTGVTVSICGVSAAIAASGAIKGINKTLLLTTLVLIVALPMLVLQPWINPGIAYPRDRGRRMLGGYNSIQRHR